MFKLKNIDVFCSDGSRFGRICKQQITNLTVVVNEEMKETYTENVYASILIFFENLKCLSIIPSPVSNYPCFSFFDKPGNVFSSSTLTTLCIHVYQCNEGEGNRKLFAQASRFVHCYKVLIIITRKYKRFQMTS